MCIKVGAYLCAIVEVLSKQSCYEVARVRAEAILALLIGPYIYSCIPCIMARSGPVLIHVE